MLKNVDIYDDHDVVCRGFFFNVDHDLSGPGVRWGSHLGHKNQLFHYHQFTIRPVKKEKRKKEKKRKRKKDADNAEQNWDEKKIKNGRLKT